MDIDSTRNAYVGAVSGLMNAAANRTDSAVKSTDEDGNPALIDQIRDKGFQAYAEEEKQKKIQKMREEILQRMGLTEDDLKNMSAEQRQQIEELIAREIQERMQAQSDLNGGDKERDKELLKALKMTEPVAGGTLLSGKMGLGPLLALQEMQAANEAEGLQNLPSGDEDAG